MNFVLHSDSIFMKDMMEIFDAVIYQTSKLMLNRIKNALIFMYLDSLLYIMWKNNFKKLPKNCLMLKSYSK
jgi:hypothetical protein